MQERISEDVAFIRLVRGKGMACPRQRSLAVTTARRLALSCVDSPTAGWHSRLREAWRLDWLRVQATLPDRAATVERYCGRFAS